MSSKPETQVLTQSGKPHEFILNTDKCWLTVGPYDLFIVRDENYYGLRVEVYNGGKFVDGAYGSDGKDLRPGPTKPDK